MTGTTTCLSIGKSTLWAVPSIHFHLAFAEEVNRLASRYKPDAIAVELGPDTVSAAAAWLRELQIGPNSRMRVALPCMLGLTKPNRRIHPDRREEALRLQRLTGRDLNTLPPEILKELLGYSGVSVLFLSPTDSIVEGIRCALELDIPLYGVDLEETADACRQAVLLQQPDSSPGQQFSLDRYVRRNVPYAEFQRDQTIDRRREVAMAARLKTVLERHQRVLFVGGLAHWRFLEEMLGMPQPRPASVQTADAVVAEGFRRVVVHPLLAIQHLDTLPAFAEQYERDRPHAATATTLSSRIDMRAVFAEKLHSAYQKHFVWTDDSRPADGILEDWEARHDFEQLLQNLCLIRQRTVPGLFAALVTAQGVMSERFGRLFAETLMEFSWAEPDQYPGIPILAPSPTEPGREVRAEYVSSDGNRSPYFYIQSMHGRSGIGARVPIPWKWSLLPPPKEARSEARGSGSRSNWIPLDDLMSALALRAMRLARDHSERPRTEVFEGSLYEGIDLKSTLRAITRGDQRIYVRVQPNRPRLTQTQHPEEDCFPFVWILRPAVENADVQWMFSTDSLSTLHKHIQDPEAWERTRQELGNTLISAALATSPSENDPDLTIPGCRVQRQERYGQLNFNPLPSVMRTAHWAERTKFRRSPILDSGSSQRAVVSMYQRRHQLDLARLPWPAALVLMAIPYAEKAVTVVAPDGFTLPSIVYREAASRRIEIRMIPLSYLPANAIRKISRFYWIPTLGRTPDEKDLPVYPEHVLRHFEQDVEAYRHLIPKSWH